MKCVSKEHGSRVRVGHRGFVNTVTNLGLHKRREMYSSAAGLSVPEEGCSMASHRHEPSYKQNRKSNEATVSNSSCGFLPRVILNYSNLVNSKFRWTAIMYGCNVT
jgi:hypothetical protein